MTASRDFPDFVAEASADPRVLGLVLTGSYARGTATAHSDHDVVLVASEGHEGRRTATLDVAVCTLEELADCTPLWQRYAFRGAKVLLDRLDGRIADLVSRLATPTTAEATEWARKGLDGYVNLLYRAAKSRRDGDVVAECPARDGR